MTFEGTVGVASNKISTGYLAANLLSVDQEPPIWNQVARKACSENTVTMISVFTKMNIIYFINHNITWDQLNHIFISEVCTKLSALGIESQSSFQFQKGLHPFILDFPTHSPIFATRFKTRSGIFGAYKREANFDELSTVRCNLQSPTWPLSLHNIELELPRQHFMKLTERYVVQRHRKGPA